MSWYAWNADGWYTGEAEKGAPNATPDPPPTDSTTTTPGEPRARWYRSRWLLMAYPEQKAAAPAPPPLPSWGDRGLDPRYHHIDVGPFLDRFGDKALVLASNIDTEVGGMLFLWSARGWLDLKRADLAAHVQRLVGKLAITRAEADAVLSPVTTEQERHIKGLPQPTP